MPNVPVDPSGLPGQVFWSAGDVLDFARILINNQQADVTGQELAYAQPYTWTLLNFAYAKLQNQLEDTNVEAVTYAEAVVGPLAAAPAAPIDPNAQVRLGYDGFWDGTNDTDPTITLPGDMLEPLELWERPAGSVQPFLPMKQQLGGLQARWGLGVIGGAGRFGLWEFRSNSGIPAIYMPGITQVQEIRIRYIPSLSLLAMNSDGTFPQIPLARAGEALAYGLAADWAEIRNLDTAPMLRHKYDEQVQIITNKSAKRENAAVTRMAGYGFNRRRRRL